jgi:hypothetical protein
LVIRLVTITQPKADPNHPDAHKRQDDNSTD